MSMAGLVAAVWSPVTIATPPTVPPPMASCSTCTPCRARHATDCRTPPNHDASVCQNEAIITATAAAVWKVPRFCHRLPFLPPPPLGPPRKDTIQIVALVMLILVCICVCGSLALVPPARLARRRCAPCPAAQRQPPAAPTTTCHAPGPPHPLLAFGCGGDMEVSFGADEAAVTVEPEKATQQARGCETTNPARKAARR